MVGELVWVWDERFVEMDGWGGVGSVECGAGRMRGVGGWLIGDVRVGGGWGTREKTYRRGGVQAYELLVERGRSGE